MNGLGGAKGVDNLYFANKKAKIEADKKASMKKKKELVFAEQMQELKKKLAMTNLIASKKDLLTQEEWNDSDYSYYHKDLTAFNEVIKKENEEKKTMLLKALSKEEVDFFHSQNEWNDYYYVVMDARL